jgi:benzoylformate decarboxylase
MDRLAERNGGTGPWPKIDSVDIGAMARAMGCDAVRVETHADLLERLDAELPALARRDAPLVLEVAVAPDPTFDP